MPLHVRIPQGLEVRVQGQRSVSEFGQHFHVNRIPGGIHGRFPPGKGSEPVHQNRRNQRRIFPLGLVVIYDLLANLTEIILFLHLTLVGRGDRNRSLEKIGMGHPEAGDFPARLRPHGRIFRMRSHHRPDIGQIPIQPQVDVETRSGRTEPLHDLSGPRRNHHVRFRSQIPVIDPPRLDHDQAPPTVEPADRPSEVVDQPVFHELQVCLVHRQT